MTLFSRKYIDDNDVVARYLAGKLSDTERESFEAYYAEHPDVLRELNTTAQFKAGLMDLHESGALEKLLKPRSWWQRPNGIALAASLTLIIGASSIWLNLQNTPLPLVAASQTALTHRFQSTLRLAGTYDIQRTRTASYDATVEKPADAAAIELRIKPEQPAASGQYRVAVGIVAADDSIAKVTEVSGLRAAADGFVPVYLNVAGLSPAVYELKLSGDAVAETANSASSFLIELVPAGSK